MEAEKSHSELQGDFNDEFAQPKDSSEDYLKKKQKVFKPNIQSDKIPDFDFKQQIKSQMHADKKKSSYSVYDDKVIIETFRDPENLQKTTNAILEQLTKKLLCRSFESVKERYRKWIRKFSEEDQDRIIQFCKDKPRIDLDNYTVRRSFDEKKGFALTEFVMLDGASRQQLNRSSQVVDEDLEGDDSDQDQPIRMKENLEESMLTYSPNFGRKQRDLQNSLEKDPLGKRIRFLDPSELEETIQDTPKKEHFIEIKRPPVRSPRNARRRPR